MENNNLKNYLSLGIALYSCYSILFSENLNYCYHVISIYSVIDLLFKNKFDIIIHHLSILQLYFSFQSLNIPERIIDLIVPTILLSEVSTIFLNVNNIVKNEFILNINKILFILTFIYFRIIKFSILIYEESYFQILFSYCNNNILTYMLYFSGIYCLYGLNIYWLNIIVKTLLKPLLKMDNYHLIIRTSVLSEFFTQYTYFFNIGITLYRYRSVFSNFTENWTYIFDIFGVGYLSIQSYRFHHNCLTNLIHGDFDLIDHNNINYYINDIYGIYYRIFSILLTSYLNTRISYNNFVIGIYNIMVIYYISINNLIMKKYRFEKIMYYDIHNTKRFIRLSIFYVIFINTLLIIYNSDNYSYIISNLIILYLLLIINVVRPFYWMNHIANHIIFYYQTDKFALFNIA